MKRRIPISEQPRRSKPNPYCHLWVVLFRYYRSEPFEIHREGARLVGFDTKAQAEVMAREIRRYQGRGNAYVQKYGPYR